MLITAKFLAGFIEQDYIEFDDDQITRIESHIKTAGNEVRGMLSSLYSIPAYVRDVDGAITDPTGLTLDPQNTILGTCVTYLAACMVLNPARGFQPQEDRESSRTYCKQGQDLLMRLRNAQAFIGSLEQLTVLGITPSATLLQMISNQTRVGVPQVRNPSSVISGLARNPDSGCEF